MPPFRRCAELLAGGCAGIALRVPQAADERTISASTVATRLDTLEAWGVVKQSLEKRRLGEHAAALDLLCSRYVTPIADADADADADAAAAAPDGAPGSSHNGSGAATAFELRRVKEIIDDLVASSANSDEALAQVSVLLFTVTFYANIAHSLTCSP